ncbi:unnamed protein product [Penicillium roqueforti FM164]|uniref:Uncharacterized protein n=1 Tax=Penicillium roqueforti (strain FM164) TaxID=1365484 RepID=W6QQ12_PENRF|nr:unnamed protein product [Penicillium roqueforti FM164]
MRSRSPPSPLSSAINQVLKACQITMQSAAFLEKEIPADEGLSVQEASQLITELVEASEAPPPPHARKPSTGGRTTSTGCIKV